MEGILEASVSASGMVRLEFDTTKTDESEILKALRKEGLDIPDTQVREERFIGKTKTPVKATRQERKGGRAYA